MTKVAVADGFTSPGWTVNNIQSQTVLVIAALLNLDSRRQAPQSQQLVVLPMSNKTLQADQNERSWLNQMHVQCVARLPLQN